MQMHKAIFRARLDSTSHQMHIFAASMKVLLLIIAVLTWGAGHAQVSSNPWRIAANAGKGFAIPHHPEMKYIIEGHVATAGLDFFKVTDGHRDWHHWFNFPSYGFSFSAFDFGSSRIGYGISGLVFLDMPITKNKAIGLKMGLGAGYISEPFDGDLNYHNTAIGSTINASLALEGYVNLKAGKHLLLRPGLALQHFSNGAMQIPNSGINIPLFKLQVSYLGLHPPVRERANPVLEKKYSVWYAGASFGNKQILPVGGPRYFIMNAFGIWERRITPKSSFGTELGVNYNESLSYRQENEGGTLLYDYRAYLAGIYRLHFEPFSLRLQMGFYLFPEFKSDGNIFLRYHLLYDLGRIQLLAGLKSHWAKADNIEIGAAYRLKKK